MASERRGNCAEARITLHLELFRVVSYSNRNVIERENITETRNIIANCLGRRWIWISTRQRGRYAMITRSSKYKTGEYLALILRRVIKCYGSCCTGGTRCFGICFRVRRPTSQRAVPPRAVYRDVHREGRRAIIPVPVVESAGRRASSSLRGRHYAAKRTAINVTVIP